MLPIETIKEELQSKLSQKRYRHSLGVADEAVRLALHYGADRDKAYLAGLVHDCAKEIPAEKAIALLKEKYGMAPDCVAVKSPNVLHGPLGAFMAQSMFQIYDPEILDAVRYHTTGKANMSLLGKIIYIADYIEPGRSYPDVDKLRNLTYEDINRAILFGIDFTIESLVKKGMVIHPDTMHCRNDIVITLDRKTEERVKEHET
jgi:predicted HD superfamily hydrolase involved in NAD metabolism